MKNFYKSISHEISINIGDCFNNFAFKFTSTEIFMNTKEATSFPLYDQIDTKFGNKIKQYEKERNT